MREARIGDIGWNVLGLGLPLVVAVLVIPSLVNKLGVEAFGLLSLLLVLISYFALVDLGLSRAITFVLARKQIEKDVQGIAKAAWSGLGLLLALGVAAGVVLVLTTQVLTTRILIIPDHLIPVANKSVWILAASIPLLTLSSGLRGVLEAAHRFEVASILRGLLGAWSFGGPWLAVMLGYDLAAACMFLVIGRFVGAFTYLTAVLAVVPDTRHFTWPSRHAAKELLRYGGWIATSNIVGPLIVQIDRLAIGALLGTAAVAYYATPNEIVTKALIIPAAVTTVLFPHVARMSAGGAQAFSESYTQAIDLVSPLLLLLTGTLAVAAQPFLTWWLNEQFAAESADVLRFLAVGVFLNGVAHIPYTLIQGVGRPSFTAKLHILEALIYVPLVFLSAARWGPNGAAVAFTARAGFDLVMLVVRSHHLGVSLASCARTYGRVGLQILIMIGLATIREPVELLVLSILAILSCYDSLHRVVTSRIRSSARNSDDLLEG